MKTLCRCVIVLALLLTAHPAAAARVNVSIGSTAVYVGQTLTVRYELSDTNDPAVPPDLEVPGCAVRYAGMNRSSQTFTRTVNGRRVKNTVSKFVYDFSIKPAAPGSYEIPPQVFTLPGGETVKSPAVSFEAGEAPTSPLFVLSVEADEEIAYVGQPIKVTWTWYTGQRLAGAEITWLPPASADVHVTDRSDPAQHRGDTATTMMGVDTRLIRDRRSKDDRVWDVYTTELVVVPTAPGVLRIPASNVLIEADTGRRRRGVSLFDSSAITEVYASRSEPLDITVKPLPSQGRPPGFTGLVGAYDIETRATPTAVRVGDPIVLTMVVRGPDLFTGVPDFDLGGMPGFETDFRVDGDDADPARTRQGLVLTRTLRAQHDGVVAIPGIELPYFDVESGRYAAARSRPIPLEVTPTRVVTLADAQGAMGEAPTGTAIESRAGGLLANVTGPAALTPEHFSARTLALSPPVLTLLTAPPAAALLAGVVVLARSRQEQNADRSRRKRALPAARGALRDAAGPDDVIEALRGYFAARWPGTASVLTPDVISRVLPPCDLEEDLIALIGDCDAARFGSAAADTPTLAVRAGQLLDRLEKEAR